MEAIHWVFGSVRSVMEREEKKFVPMALKVVTLTAIMVVVVHMKFKCHLEWLFETILNNLQRQKLKRKEKPNQKPNKTDEDGTLSKGEVDLRRKRNTSGTMNSSLNNLDRSNSKSKKQKKTL